jgi:hypothetical protein
MTTFFATPINPGGFCLEDGYAISIAFYEGTNAQQRKDAVSTCLVPEECASSFCTRRYPTSLGVSVRISVRLYFIMSERLIDATSILHYELEAPPV